MNIYVNSKREKAVKRRRTIFAMLNTAVILIVLFTISLALISSYLPEFVDSPLLLIGMGIISSLVGVITGNALSKSPDPTSAINSGLKGFSSDSHLFHYYFEANHLLISPYGIFSITPLPQPINLTLDTDSLTVNNPLHQRLLWIFTNNPVGSPISSSLNTTHSSTQTFNEILNTDSIVIHPILCLTHPDSQSTLKNPNIPLTYSDKRKPSLKQTIRSYEYTTLSNSDIEILLNYLNIS